MKKDNWLIAFRINKEDIKDGTVWLTLLLYYVIITFIVAGYLSYIKTF